MKKIFFILLSFIVGCSSDNDKEILTVPLGYGIDKVLPFEESGFDYSYEILPLEVDTSNVDSFIGRAYRFIVHKDYIYIPDYNNAPKIFTSKGKFVKCLPQGRGPGEIVGQINDIYIDTENDCLEVAAYSKILRFTLWGDFMGEVKQKEICSDICKFGDYTISYDGLVSLDSCFVKVVNHHTGKRICDMLPKNIKDGGSLSWGMMATGVFMRNRENIFFIIPLTNEIYKIERGDSLPCRFAKLDNVLSYDEYPEFNPLKIEEYALSRKKYAYISNLSVSMDEQLISFRVKENRTNDGRVEYRVVYDRAQNKIFKYPVKMVEIVYSDEEYDYGMVFPEQLEGKRDLVGTSEKPLMDKLYEYIDRNGVNTNPYVVKIKIFKK